MAKHSFLIEEPAVLQSYLTENIWTPRFWRDFFPLKYSPTIEYKVKNADKGAQVAAEVVAFGSEAPKKMRETFSTKYGQIPPIRVKRVMDEDDILEYETALRQPQSTPADLMSYIFDDVRFVYEAIEAEREYLALLALSNFTISLSVTTNPNQQTQTTLDFGLASTHKLCVYGTDTNRRWGTGSISQIKPITDFYKALDMIEDLGVEPPKYAVMNTTQFRQFIQADEVVDFAKPMAYNQPPRASLVAINAGLAQVGLPEIIVVNNRIRREIHDSVAPTRTTTNPWTDGYITLMPSLQAGYMLYTDPPAKGREETNLQSYNAGVLVSKWAENDPIREYTKGETVCLPVIPNVSNMFRFKPTTSASDGLDTT